MKKNKTEINVKDYLDYTTENFMWIVYQKIESGEVDMDSINLSKLQNDHISELLKKQINK